MKKEKVRPKQATTNEAEEQKLVKRDNRED
jgi:hypothetical protein